MVFHCDQPLDTAGGHLQGIQSWSTGGVLHYALTGSSANHAYLVMVDGTDMEVVNIQKLMSKPYKHAGGFQVYHHYAAIGIEDNEDRNHSYVMIYEVTSPQTDAILIDKVERKGDYERTTAGCVAITHFDDQWLLAVGDWNTRHLDLYRSNLERPDSFQLFQTITASEMDRTTWSDSSWLPYQNLNFFISQEELYLAGMTSDDHNVLDIFSVSFDSDHSLILQKIASQQFSIASGQFVWGAGLAITQGIIQSLLTCERNLKKGKNLIEKYEAAGK